MKRTYLQRALALLLSLLMMAGALVVMPLFGASGHPVGTLTAHPAQAVSYDNFFVNGNAKFTQNVDGKLDDIGNTVNISEGGSIGLRGWIGFGSTEILHFGYYINNATQSVYVSNDFFEYTDDTIKGIAGSGARRFNINVGLNGFEPGSTVKVGFVVWPEGFGELVLLHKEITVNIGFDRTTDSRNVVLAPANEAVDTIEATQLANNFSFYATNGTTTLTSTMAHDSKSGMYKLTNYTQLVRQTHGSYVYTVEFAQGYTDAIGHRSMFIRGIEEFNFGDGGYFGHDSGPSPDANGNASSGCAGIYMIPVQTATGYQLQIRIKEFQGAGKAAKVHYFNVDIQSLCITVVDEGKNITILAGDTVVATLFVDGRTYHQYSGGAIDQASAQTVKITLADGTVETITNAALAAGNQYSDIGLQTRNNILEIKKIELRSIDTLSAAAPQYLLDADDIANNYAKRPNDHNYNKDSDCVEHELSNGESYVTLTLNKDPNNTGATDPYVFMKVTGGSCAPTGKIFAVRYRTNTYAQAAVYIGSGSLDGNTDVKTFGYIGDGEWHLLLIDLSDVTAYTGAAAYIRYDFFGTNAGVSIDIAYAGIFDTKDHAKAYDLCHSAGQGDKAILVYNAIHMTTDGTGYQFDGNQDSIIHTSSPKVSHHAEYIVFDGWVSVKGDLGQFGYQVDGYEAVFEDAFSVETPADEITSATNFYSGDHGQHYTIKAPLADPATGEKLTGAHTVKFLYRNAEGETVDLTTYYPNIDPTAPIEHNYASDGLISMYQGQNGGSTWEDVIGFNDVALTVNETNKLTTEGLYQNSQRQYFPDPLVNLINRNAFTVEFHMKNFERLGTDFGTILASQNEDLSVFLRQNGDQLEVKWAGQTTTYRPTAQNGTATLGTDVTLTVVFRAAVKDENGAYTDSGRVAIYANGVMLAETAAIGDGSRQTMSVEDLFLGEVADQKNFQALFASVRFYNRELTPTEIMSNALEDNTVKSTELEGSTASLGDNIGINFYVQLTQDVARDEDAYMEISLPHGETKILQMPTTPTTVGGNAYFEFNCFVDAKDMTSGVHAKIIDSEGNVVLTIERYTVKDYCEKIINGDAYSRESKELAAAMLRYGAAAQTRFNYKTDNLADGGLSDKTVPSVTANELAEYEKTRTDSIGELTYYGTSAVLDDKIAIRHYFQVNEGQTLDRVTFTIQKGDGEVKEMEIKQGDGQNAHLCYIEITGIVAVDMDTFYTLTITNQEGDIQTIKYSVFSYAYDILNGATNNENTKKVMMAAYRYWEAAEAYFATVR